MCPEAYDRAEKINEAEFKVCFSNEVNFKKLLERGDLYGPRPNFMLIRSDINGTEEKSRTKIPDEVIKNILNIAFRNQGSEDFESSFKKEVSEYLLSKKGSLSGLIGVPLRREDLGIIANQLTSAFYDFAKDLTTSKGVIEVMASGGFHQNVGIQSMKYESVDSGMSVMFVQLLYNTLKLEGKLDGAGLRDIHDRKASQPGLLAIDGIVGQHTLDAIFNLNKISNVVNDKILTIKVIQNLYKEYYGHEGIFSRGLDSVVGRKVEPTPAAVPAAPAEATVSEQEAAVNELGRLQEILDVCREKLGKISPKGLSREDNQIRSNYQKLHVIISTDITDVRDEIRKGFDRGKASINSNIADIRKNANDLLASIKAFETTVLTSKKSGPLPVREPAKAEPAVAPAEAEAVAPVAKVQPSLPATPAARETAEQELSRAFVLAFNETNANVETVASFQALLGNINQSPSNKQKLQDLNSSLAVLLEQANQVQTRISSLPASDRTRENLILISESIEAHKRAIETIAPQIQELNWVNEGREKYTPYLQSLRAEFTRLSERIDGLPADFGKRDLISLAADYRSALEKSERGLASDIPADVRSVMNAYDVSIPAAAYYADLHAKTERIETLGPLYDRVRQLDAIYSRLRQAKDSRVPDQRKEIDKLNEDFETPLKNLYRQFSRYKDTGEGDLEQMERSIEGLEKKQLPKVEPTESLSEKIAPLQSRADALTGTAVDGLTLKDGILPAIESYSKTGKGDLAAIEKSIAGLEAELARLKQASAVAKPAAPEAAPKQREADRGSPVASAQTESSKYSNDYRKKVQQIYDDFIANPEEGTPQLTDLSDGGIAMANKAVIRHLLMNGYLSYQGETGEVLSSNRNKFQSAVQDFSKGPAPLSSRSVKDAIDERYDYLGRLSQDESDSGGMVIQPTQAKSGAVVFDPKEHRAAIGDRWGTLNNDMVDYKKQVDLLIQNPLLSREDTADAKLMKQELTTLETKLAQVRASYQAAGTYTEGRYDEDDAALDEVSKGRAGQNGFRGITGIGTRIQELNEKIKQQKDDLRQQEQKSTQFNPGLESQRLVNLAADIEKNPKYGSLPKDYYAAIKAACKGLTQQSTEEQVKAAQATVKLVERARDDLYKWRELDKEFKKLYLHVNPLYLPIANKMSSAADKLETHNAAFLPFIGQPKLVEENLSICEAAMGDAKAAVEAEKKKPEAPKAKKKPDWENDVGTF
ncbi:MAG: hypothetical protein WCT31_01890 [Candidatus Micrarchaeia archaeon]